MRKVRPILKIARNGTRLLLRIVRDPYIVILFTKFVLNANIDHDDIIEFFEQLVARGPKDRMYQGLLAIECYNTQKYERAVLEFEKYIHLAPKPNPRVFYYLAASYFYEKDSDRSYIYCKQFLKVATDKNSHEEAIEWAKLYVEYHEENRTHLFKNPRITNY